MKTKLIPILIFSFCLLTSGATAQVPGLINYQGRLVDGGTPVNSNVVVAICIYTGETAVVAGHVEDVGNVAVVNGLYSFTFGTNEVGMVASLAEPEAWLEVKIDSVPLTPRQRLISVPYSRNAAALGTVLAEESLPSAGAIRWNGSAFEGFNGIAWIPLSGTLAGAAPEMVMVGNAGNAADTGGTVGAGTVSNEYQIGKYEVTNAEYSDFLNAVDPDGANTLALYNASMNSSSHGGITLTGGNPVGSKYVLKGGFATKPVVYVSFYDAMRFCNWLHNGAVEGGDTENGAYTLLGGVATPTNGTTVQRNAGAKFTVPTEDEWYKAAYYEPGGDADGYWLYPTRSNSAPDGDSPPGIPPAANYDDFGGGLPNTVTAVGAYTGTVGFYGTFDMAGNVFEWNETLNGSSRVLRGGSWDFLEFYLQSDFPFTVSPGIESGGIGFRVSSP